MPLHNQDGLNEQLPRKINTWSSWFDELLSVGYFEVLTSSRTLHTHQMNKNILKLYDVDSPFTKLITDTIQQTFSDARPRRPHHTRIMTPDCNGSGAVIQWHLMQFWPDTRVFVREDLKVFSVQWSLNAP